jgi:hypothetical protein
MTLFDAVSENGIFAEAIKIFYRQAETRRPSTFYEDLKTPEDDSILLCSRERNGWARSTLGLRHVARPEVPSIR